MRRPGRRRHVGQTPILKCCASTLRLHHPLRLLSRRASVMPSVSWLATTRLHFFEDELARLDREWGRIQVVVATPVQEPIGNYCPVAGASGVAEVDRHPRRHRDLLVLGHLASLVPSHRPAQLFRKTGHGLDHRGGDGSGSQDLPSVTTDRFARPTSSWPIPSGFLPRRRLSRLRAAGGTARRRVGRHP